MSNDFFLSFINTVGISVTVDGVFCFNGGIIVAPPVRSAALADLLPGV